MKFISPEERANLHQYIGNEGPTGVLEYEGGNIIEASGPSAENRSSEETVNFDELPLIWQEHIRKRKELGKIEVAQNTFTKAEIIKAASDQNSFTELAVIDKLFDRRNKEKINFEDLPAEWQKILEPENKFGNFTVEYLKQRGAREEDLEKIRSGQYKNIQSDIKDMIILEDTLAFEETPVFEPEVFKPIASTEFTAHSTEPLLVSGSDSKNNGKWWNKFTGFFRRASRN